MRFSERKGAEKAIFSGKCLHRFVWEQDAAGSSHVTPTKKQTSFVYQDRKGQPFEKRRSRMSAGRRFLTDLTAAEMILCRRFAKACFRINGLFFVNSFYSCAVKCGIVCIEIALVLAGLLRYCDSLAEALIVDYLPLAQETYRVDDIRIIHKAEDIVIGQPRLLLCCDILMQICKNIAGHLKRGDGERSP